MIEEDEFWARRQSERSKKYGLTVKPDWRYRQFFSFLQLSPSYRLAHLIATQKVERSSVEDQVPADFDIVLQTYQLFGDVWLTDSISWWIKKGQYAFGVKSPPISHQLGMVQPDVDVDEAEMRALQEEVAQYLVAGRAVEGKPGCVIVAIPLHEKRKDILKGLSKIVDNALSNVRQGAPMVKLEILKNKIHSLTLDNARRVAWARAAIPKKPLYVVGNKVNLTPAYVTKEGEKLLKTDHRREKMSIVTSRQLQRARIISENAARGIFPSLDQPAHCLEFDFMELRRSIISHRDWMKAEKARLERILKLRAEAGSTSKK